MMRPTPFHRCAVLALALSLSACGDSLLRPELEPGAASFAKGGKAGGFDVVNVRDIPKPAGTPGPVVNNLSDALARVNPGGTIRVHSGTYVAERLLIDRAVTIEAAGGDRPVIVTPAGVNSGFEVSGVESGTVTFRGLQFQVHGDYAVRARATYDQVVVEDCGFAISGRAGVLGSLSSVAGAEVVVRNSSFSGGQYGVMAAGHVDFGGPHLDVLNSTFADHSFSGIQHQVRSSGRIEGNTLERCGTGACIRVHSPAGVEVIANRASNEVGREVRSGILAFAGGSITIHDNEVVGTGGDAFVSGIEVSGTEAVVTGNRVGGAEQGIQFYSVAEGLIEGNTVSPCGGLQCIGVNDGGGNVAVVNNTMQTRTTGWTAFGIAAHWPAGSGRLTLVGNTVRGAPGADKVLSVAIQAIGRYDDQPAGEMGAEVWAEGNRIYDAGDGMQANFDGILAGRDNYISRISRVALSSAHDGINRVRFSDIQDYDQAIAWGGEQFDVTCNWWGRAAGPQNVADGVPSSAYRPFATAPVAGTGASTCSGGQ